MTAGLKKLYTLKFLILCPILAALIIAACGEYSGSEPGNSFARDLRGTWESNDPSVYSGTLVIGYNTITISGYDESQAIWLPNPNPNQLPFKAFTKGTELSGYAADGTMYILDRGAWQDGIPYAYYTAGSSTNKKEFLLFNFDERDERLQKTAAY